VPDCLHVSILQTEESCQAQKELSLLHRFVADRRLCLYGAVWAFLFAAFLPAAQRLPAADPPQEPLRVGNQSPAEFPGLHNVFRLSKKLYGGSMPEGDEGFQSLQRLGIRTVISVDGARPEVERARKYGMRYVHLPFGYDGCPSPRAAQIVRAVRDLPGPVYLHCHHGRHRSPAAAAFARIVLDGISNEEAVEEMERAGTGKNYIGLYEEVRAYEPPTKEEIDAVKADFPEVAPVPPMMEAMVRMQRRLDHLLLSQKEGWQVPARHPDVKPAHEALQLREHFTEMLRTPDVKKKPSDFREWMRRSENDSRKLEAALRAGNHPRATASLGRVAATCGSCHAKYRNVPQVGVRKGDEGMRG
jgi:protein tyrosine phosphatase (PTP) superfamily phosphohydrolase (DUF442 family)